jgi:alpha-tubulin suppressor-like RCC1 family protein
LLEPKRLEALCMKGIQITKMACGIKHTALINNKNELICFGSNEFG